jgi:hypothetical protein
MKGPGALLFIIPFLSLGSAMFAQEDSVFAPFVSRLSVETQGDTIKLTWIDSRDVTGPVYVSRSTQPIQNTVGLSKLPSVEVPYGAQSYIDRLDTSGTWYFSVMASDGKGRRYDVIIPYNNTISVKTNLAGDEKPLKSMETAETPPLAAKSSAGVGVTNAAEAQKAVPFSDISATVQGDGVNLSFHTLKGGKTVVVYRNAQPIQTTQDLLDAVIVQTGVSSSPFIDYPVPGIPYYYAIFLEDDLKTGTATIEKGKNATIVPVEIPAGKYRIGLPGPQNDVRSMPLPLLSIYTAYPNADPGSGIPAPQPLSEGATKAVAQWATARTEPAIPDKKPRAFSQDLSTPAGGEEYALKTVVQGPFARKDWEAVKDQLSKYLSLPRSSASEGRARFYLGQAFYFSADQRSALFEFLLVQSSYPQEATEWIQAVLPRLLINAEP